MFKKFDGKKNRLELIEPEFIEGLGRILSFGADKYEAHNWKLASSDEDQNRIYGALLRHLVAYHKGEKVDQETGESHLYHACCNLMFLDYQDRQQGSFCGAMDEKTSVSLDITDNDYVFPLNKTATTNVINQGLHENGYVDWCLLGYTIDGYAIIRNINAKRTLMVTDFADFVRHEASGVNHNWFLNV